MLTSVKKMSLALRAITGSLEDLKLRSTCAAGQNDCGNSAKQNRCIKPQRPMIDVLEIELHPLLERKVAATGNLPQTGQAGLHAETSLLPRLFHACRIAHRQRPGTNDAH